MPSIRWKLTELDIVAYRLQDDDSGDFGPEPVVQFGKKVGLPDGIAYYSDHISEDGTHIPEGLLGTTYSIPIQLDIPAQSAGTLTFTATGTAVSGVNYTILTPSPLTIEAGASSASIEVLLLDALLWFDERSLILTITGGDNVTLGQKLEWRLWINSSRSAPTASWNSSSGSGGAGTYPLRIDLSARMLETFTPYYRVTTDLIEGVDYTLTASGSGEAFIQPGDTHSEQAGSNSPDFVLTPAGATKTGETVTVELDHEPIDLPDRSTHWKNTDDWSQDLWQPDFAGEPTTHSSGGGAFPDTDGDGEEDVPFPFAEGNVVIGQDETAHPQLGTPFWSIPSGNRVLAPDGSVMQAILMSSQAQTDFYIRESFEAERLGMPSASAPIKRWNLLSYYLAPIPTPENARNAQFVKLTLRNRPKDVENSVAFWRQSDGFDSNGDASVIQNAGAPTDTVTINGETWGLWNTSNTHANDLWGVDAETVNGQTYARVWFLHHVPDAGFDYTNNKGDTVNQVQGDTQNALLRFTMFDPGDNTGTRTESSQDIQGGSAGARGKGALVWGPQYIRSDNQPGSPLPVYEPASGDSLTALGRFYSRASNFPRPRGNAYMNTGGTVSYVFTVA